MSRFGDEPVRAIKQHLAAEIVRSLGGKSAQYVIAPHFGIRQPRASELAGGNVDRCTIDWLMRRIHRLGGSVVVTVTLGDAVRQWNEEVRARLAARTPRS